MGFKSALKFQDLFCCDVDTEFIGGGGGGMYAGGGGGGAGGEACIG